ncbi:hypothetical protein IQ235_01220 [Oscillatoriales cyanobacterium LEGE 11467]|uniref:Uncharacterized protein n=1 Tax=Zarconia navalis LEGE 11467 TaxID=1828826 RepID=A0A928Z835_9CYAN|nr:hypothetical protein [Zarconia navalis]MBE9039416.1 hypothetical protein [Zarconia navalis LEGE 11467]
MSDRNPGFRRKKGLKFWGWVVVGLAIVLAVWSVGGNYVASRQAREIDRDLAEFARQFPNTEPNDSALKLAALVAKLGVGAGGTVFEFDRYMGSSADFSPSEVDRKEFGDIQEELTDYLNAQISKPDDTFDPPSEK